jgi:Ca2+-binding EF-hand superfamily protein
MLQEKLHDEEANQILKEYQNKKEGEYERKKDENSYCSLSVKLKNLT